MAENNLIAYYSRSGNTRKIADLIQKEIGGDLFEILPKVPYPELYNAVVDQAKIEIRTGFKPALASTVDHFGQYGNFFVGSPNWWSTVAPPVTTFLTSYDFSGKTIAPFCTHGGGGLGRIDKDLAKFCPRSVILDCFTTYGDGGANIQSRVLEWLNRIEMLR